MSFFNEYPPKPVVQLLERKPYLTWSSSDKHSISLPTAIFAILNYGDFDDVKLLLKSIGIDRAKDIFERQLSGRNGYDKKVKHFFNLYFARHASRNSR